MITELTEAWGAAYIESVVTLFVFALGLPALVYQIGIPPDLVTIIARNRWVRRTWLLVMAMPYVCIGAVLIWWFHPVNETPVSSNDATTVAFLMSFILVWSICPWIYVGRVATRTRVTKKLLRQIEIGLFFQRKFDEPSLVDLGHVAGWAEPGREKEQPIDALIQVSRSFYRDTPEGSVEGDELKSVLLQLERAVLSGAKLGNDENFLKVGDHIEWLIRTLRKLNPRSESDLSISAMIIERLGCHVVNNMAKPTALMFLQNLKLMPESLLQYALHALAKGDYALAIAAFRTLECMAEPSHCEHRTGWAAYLALSARFLDDSEPRISDLAVASFQHKLDQDHRGTHHQIELASTYFIATGRFDLARLLRSLVLKPNGVGSGCPTMNPRIRRLGTASDLSGPGKTYRNRDIKIGSQHRYWSAPDSQCRNGGHRLNVAGD